MGGFRRRERRSHTPSPAGIFLNIFRFFSNYFVVLLATNIFVPIASLAPPPRWATVPPLTYYTGRRYTCLMETIRLYDIVYSVFLLINRHCCARSTAWPPSVPQLFLLLWLPVDNHVATILPLALRCAWWSAGLYVTTQAGYFYALSSLITKLDCTFRYHF